MNRAARRAACSRRKNRPSRWRFFANVCHAGRAAPPYIGQPSITDNGQETMAEPILIGVNLDGVL
ncbi:hypothetical protein, partial [Burkholderia cenocepacia]|uniref:hypothetical protein n=1 Tax=Burkholderia cenocepacia TaxID=95486 RepID=UPI001955C2FC